MSLADLIDRMISAGVSPGEAGALAAEIYAAGVASVAGKLTNAERQQRYRDRKRNAERNESVTERNAEDVTKTVTNRNESVTNVTPLSISNEDSKKERRGTQLPEAWKPDEVRWTAACRKFGEDGATRELQKFTAHHRAKGTVFKNWGSGWDKWLINANDWAPKQLAGVGVVHRENVNWRAVLESYKKYKTWPKGHGNDPTSPACWAPSELLREFGFNLRRMDA